LAFCSGAFSDGLITDTQLRLIVGIGLTGLTQRAATLVKHGLWERVDGGYRIRSWLKWNRSLAEIEEFQAADAARKRGIRTESGRNPHETQPDSGRTPDGIRTESAPHVRAGAGARTPKPSQAKQEPSQAKQQPSQAVRDGVRTDNRGGGPPRAAAEQFIIDNLGATVVEASTLAERIETDRRPRNLGGLLRTLHRDGDLAQMLDELRTADAHTAVAEAIDTARKGPPCPHGERGGAALHPATGKPLCPLCRANLALADRPERTTSE
jgi:hypothetical protein